MAWHRVTTLSVVDMLKHASNRRRVRLADGRPVDLVRWPADGRGRARVQTSRGKAFTVDVASVVEADVPDPSGKSIHLDV